MKPWFSTKNKSKGKVGNKTVGALQSQDRLFLTFNFHSQFKSLDS